MNEIVLIIALLVAIIGIGALCILCFLIGAKTAQKIANNEPVELPRVNPVEAYNEWQSNKKLEQEMDDISKSLENINNYGSDKPQIDI